MPTERQIVNIHRCLKCQHRWQAKDEKSPKRCAKCKSRTWNKP